MLKMENTKLMGEVKIRTGEKRDCAECARLIAELAEYEKLQNQNKITKEVLEEDGFGEEQYFRLIVAEDLSKPDGARLVGYILYFFNYSTIEGRCIFVEDFFISSDYRRQGLGTKLFRKATQIGLDKGCQRVCWNALDWNDIAIGFYKKLGSKNLTESEGWRDFRLERSEMEKLAQS